MTIWDTAEDAGWKIREAAWSFEDRYLWRGERAVARGGDAARTALEPARAAGERALNGMEPLQRLVQTKLAWPVADAARDGSTVVRTGLATAAVAAVAATSAGAVSLAGEGDAGTPQAKVAANSPTLASASVSTLSGVTPNFAVTEGEKVAVAAPAPAPKAGPEAKAPPEEPAPIPVPEPTASPVVVGTAFAEAFVRYEVGKTDASTSSVFAAVANKPLHQTLQQDPPRLPDGTEVPEARVLNVVAGKPETVTNPTAPSAPATPGAKTEKGQDAEEVQQVEVSVSLARMQAASELRLTLESTPTGWQVTEVRG